MRTHIALLLPLALGLALASPERSRPEGMFVARPHHTEEGLCVKFADSKPLPMKAGTCYALPIGSSGGSGSTETTLAASGPTISKPSVLSPPLPTPRPPTVGKGVYHNTAPSSVEPVVAAEGGPTTLLGEQAQPSLMYWWHKNDGTPVYVPAEFYYGGLQVVPCESSWNQYVIGKLGEITWWQFLRDGYFYDRLAELGYTEQEIRTDPGKASELAVLYWRYRGWAPWWSCSKKAGLL